MVVKKRRKKRVTPEVTPIEPLPLDLQAILDAVDKTPQEQAKMTRQAFAVRGYPNKDHKETVRDFLIQNKIPII